MSDQTGFLHHLSIHVSDLRRSNDFWGWFLGKLGYSVFDVWKDGVSYKRGCTYLDFIQVEDEYRRTAHDRERPGMHHLAFHAASRGMVDQLTTEMRERGVTLLYPDQHPFAGGPHYYALYFEDPDGIKVEVVAPD